MLYLSLKTERERAKIARISLASVLLLVLLSSIVPFSALASRGCKMACCIAKLSHGRESCSVKFAGENQLEESDNQGEEHSAHNHAQHAGAHSSSLSDESSQTASPASQAMTSPCSPECCTGALSSVQERRQRDQAIIADAAKLRPSTPVVFSRQSINPARFLSHLRDQNTPRGPPLFT